MEEEEGEKEEEKKGERNTNLLFYLFVHSLVDSCTCPDWGWNGPATLACWEDVLTNRATWPAPDSTLYFLSFLC